MSRAGLFSKKVWIGIWIDQIILLDPNGQQENLVDTKLFDRHVLFWHFTIEAKSYREMGRIRVLFVFF